MTPTQQVILDFITEYHEKNGYAPALSEITEGVGYTSKGAAHAVITRLVEKGYIRRGPSGSARNLELVRHRSWRVFMSKEGRWLQPDGSGGIEASAAIFTKDEAVAEASKHPSRLITPLHNLIADGWDLRP